MKEKKQNEEKEMMQNAESKRKELINLKHTIDHNKEMFQAKVNKNKYNVKTVCVCGGRYCTFTKSNHLKTKKHINHNITREV